MHDVCAFASIIADTFYIYTYTFVFEISTEDLLMQIITFWWF